MERFAAHGFVAIAPALFDVFGPRIELDYDQDGVQRGLALVQDLGFERALEMVKAAAGALSGSVEKTGVVGYCWGGSVALLANTRLGLPAVGYYGGRSMSFLHERQRAPLMLHFGEHDPIIPPADVEAHREALPEAQVFVYDAGPGFNCEERKDYDESAAQLALQRTLRFFEQALHP